MPDAYVFAQLRAFLGLSKESTEIDVFCECHRDYYESMPHIAADYGMKYYVEFKETGALPFFVRRVLERARETARHARPE